MVFAKGQSGNPKGRPKDGYQSYGERAKLLQDNYTIGEILKIVANPKEFKKLPVRDGQIFLQLAETLGGKDMRLERECLLDRMEGKANQSVSMSGNVGLIAIVMEAIKPQEASPILEHEQTTLETHVIENKPLITEPVEASLTSKS